MAKTMTAVQACEFLGLNFNQWRTAMWAFHKGDPVIKKGQEVGRKRGHWMPTPINLAEFEAKGQAGYSAKTALFDFDDIERLAQEERTLKSGRAVGVFHQQEAPSSAPIMPNELELIEKALAWHKLDVELRAGLKIPVRTFVDSVLRMRSGYKRERPPQKRVKTPASTTVAEPVVSVADRVLAVIPALPKYTTATLLRHKCGFTLDVTKAALVELEKRGRVKKVLARGHLNWKRAS